MLNAAQGFVYNKFQKPNDWPKIEDTFDYKYDNGKLIGGNKNLFLSGPVTYEKVGNPVIKDGIASGFSDSDYLSLINQQLISGITDFELAIKFTTSTINIRQGLGGITDGFCGCYISANNKLRILVVDFINKKYLDADSGFYISSNTTYYVKNIFRDGKTYYSYSQDGINYTTVEVSATKNLPEAITTLNNYCFGYNGQGVFTGSIDLNQTYIKVNDRLWFYGKNYTTSNMVPVPVGLEYNNTTAPSNGWVYTNSDLVKGPVGYTVVGSPTIVDGIASGFDANTFIRPTLSLPLANANIDIEIAINADTTFNNAQQRVFSAGGLYIRCLGVNPTWNIYFGEDASSVYMGLVSTYPYIKVIRTSGIWYCYMSSDGASYKQVGTPTAGHSLQDSMVNLGGGGSSHWAGSINLNETYIKVNGVPWFGNVSRFQEFIPAPEEAQIGKDDTHNLVVETPIIKGQVDYTVVGNPTIVDGIASGFVQDSSYLQTTSILPYSTASSIEFVCKYSCQKTFLLANFGGCNLFINSSGNLVFYSNPSLYVASNAMQHPYVKFIQNGKDSIPQIYFSDDGEHFVEVALITGPNSSTFADNVVPFGKLTQSADNSIDLNQTYIKVNGQYWFKPKTELLSPKMIGPVGYNVTGNPTIVDGIASGFSASNFLTTASAIPLNSTVEMLYKLSCNNYQIVNFVCSFQGNSSGIVFTTDGKLRFFGFDKDNTYFSISGNNIFNTNTLYYIKCVIQDDVATIYYSTDGINFIVDITKTNYTLNRSSSPVTMGAWDTRVLTGSLDLNQTYIKINGKLWFGKEDWTPSTHIDNAIYLLGSHNTDYSTYNTQGINPTIETESDESGTYNVWIDNQEIYKEQSNPLDINWSNLALTTGYNITTPSTLKAHVIKVEPNNGNITRFSTTIEEDSDESI